MDVAPAGMDDPDDGDELGHLQGHAGQHRGVRRVQPAVREYHWGGAAHQQQRAVTDSAEFQACRDFCPVCTGGRVMYSPVACQGDIADIA